MVSLTRSTAATASRQLHTPTMRPDVARRRTRIIGARPARPGARGALALHHDVPRPVSIQPVSGFASPGCGTLRNSAVVLGATQRATSDR